MTRIISPKLKIITESDDELIDQFEYNWPQLDKYAHPVPVATGVMPPDSDLFDGCILSETPANNNRVWMARKNDAGVYQKSWIAYEWAIGVQSNGISVIGSTGDRGWDAGLIPGSKDCANSSAADLDPATKKIITPMTGLYSISYAVHHVNQNNNAFASHITWEGTSLAESEIVARTTAAAVTKVFATKEFRLDKGSKIGWECAVFGVQQVISCRMWMTLIAAYDLVTGF